MCWVRSEKSGCVWRGVRRGESGAWGNWVESVGTVFADVSVC